MSSTYFPLRWESTGDQWWYASPIDWAAANGHYDLVRELLHLDTNLLIKLTSLRRIRRLETVWDDEAQFNEAAKCRSQVAKNLLMECETNRGLNSLIRAGYGGWLLYTAASAGDLGFVNEILERDPSLVFGEGEYGVTDILYAAARSKNSEVFRLLLQFSVSRGLEGETEGKSEENCAVFRSEMMNRAVHAAARGGNLEMLKEILGDCSDVLVYRDAEGSTLLHTASGRGQVEVVKDLLASYDIITSKDNRGNTALNVAAYRGNLAVVEVLILASPSVASITNNNGDTFLHMAVAGFRSPGFRRLDRQIELMKKLVCGKLVNIEDMINIRNSDGRTALHMAVSENIQSDVVELLMSVPLINLNICDDNGMTPLDLLKQRPKSASSEILIKRLISAGGIFNGQDQAARIALASHLKMQGIGGSPGTSFRVSDAEIFLYTSEPVGREYGYYSGEISSFNSPSMSDNKKLSSVNSAAKRLKILLRWPRKGKKHDSESLKSYNSYDSFENSPVSLRQKFTKQGSLPNNKRIHAIRNGLPSPSTKKKFSARLMHGVIQDIPSSPSSRFSQSSMSSPISTDMQKDASEIEGGNFRGGHKKFSPINKKLMNRYFCFGAQGLAADDSASCKQPRQSYKRSTSLMT